jgi:hypothetical protein
MANELKPNGVDSILIQIAVEGFIVKVTRQLERGGLLDAEVHVFTSRKTFQDYMNSLVGKVA